MLHSARVQIPSSSFPSQKLDFFYFFVFFWFSLLLSFQITTSSCKVYLFSIHNLKKGWGTQVVTRLDLGSSGAILAGSNPVLIILFFLFIFFYNKKGGSFLLILHPTIHHTTKLSLLKPWWSTQVVTRLDSGSSGAIRKGSNPFFIIFLIMIYFFV